MKSNMIADDPAQTFRRLYEAKNPRAIDPDDDRVIPADDDDQQAAGEYGMGDDSHGSGEQDERPDDPEEPFVRVRCSRCRTAVRMLPPKGFRFVERDDQDDADDRDDLAKRMRFTCSTCETGNRITRLKGFKLVRVEAAREAADFFADHYRGRLQPSTRGLDAVETFRTLYRERADMAADDGDDAAVTAFREAHDRFTNLDDWKRARERYGPR